MKIYDSIQNLTGEFPRIAIALGMFDGVHIGHQSILNRTVELANKIEGTPAVFTFQNHPLSLVSIERENNRGMPKLIGDRKLRAEILESLGIKLLVEIPFTEEFSRNTPLEFIDLLQKNFEPRFVVTGPNYTFGHRGEGDGDLLKKLGRGFGFIAEICPAIVRDGKKISSTRIRRLISDGNLKRANEFLGRSFSYRGKVIHGFERGRTIGFPTANLEIDPARVMLPTGAYAVEVEFENQNFIGIANVGNNPTFEEQISSRIEVFIDNFSGDLYGREIEIRFIETLRSEQKFSSVEDLISQLKMDLEHAREILPNKK